MCTLYTFSENSDQKCQDAVRSFHGTCLPKSESSNTTDVYISPRDQTQEALENIISLGINFVNSTSQCQEVIIPFLCFYYLRPCDADGVTYQPSVEDCIDVSTHICPREWAQTNCLLQSFGQSLPTCSMLESEASLQCDIVGAFTKFPVEVRVIYCITITL